MPLHNICLINLFQLLKLHKEKPDGNGGPGGAPGGSSADIDYTGAVEISSGETRSGESYTSTTADENALLIATSEEVTVTDPAVSKSGDSDGGDNCNFYGLNAGVLVKDGSTTTITGGTITTDADGANGVFCYGGNGGHNGLKDIQARLGSANFWRLRIGISHPGDKNQVVSYVLKKPTADEQQLIDNSILRAIDEIETIVQGDFAAAMCELHKKI